MVVHEKYISHEESGLYASEDVIRTDKDFYKSTGLYSPDEEVQKNRNQEGEALKSASVLIWSESEE